jgi:hypothetical protein
MPLTVFDHYLPTSIGGSASYPDKNLTRGDVTDLTGERNLSDDGKIIRHVPFDNKKDENGCTLSLTKI